MENTLRIWLAEIGVFFSANLFPAIIISVVGILAIRLIGKLLKSSLEKTRMDKNLCKLLIGIVQPVLYLVVGLIAADKLGIDVTSIVALASVLTLAVSLTLQNVLGNIFGGFTLLYTKPFAAGDFVEIAGQTGTVREVGLAYTKLTTPDNKLVSIPNSSVVAAQITNYTATGKRRVDIEVCVSADVPAQRVLDALAEAAQVPTRLEDPAFSVGMAGYQDGAARYSLLLWCATPDYWTTLYKVNESIQDTFAKAKIPFHLPKMQINMEK